MAAITFATISYDADAPNDCEMNVTVTEVGKSMLSQLTDFELRVFAAEASLRVRKRIEMPPSPGS